MDVSKKTTSGAIGALEAILSSKHRTKPPSGFLLTADWDAAFGAGLVSFDPVGAVLFSPALGQAARARLGDGRLRNDRPLTAMHRGYLAWHSTRIFKA
jgi:hypothetical protein